MMIAAAIVASLLWIPLDSRTIVALWLFVGYGIIGFIDDGLKIFFKRNLGLTSKQKMALQILVAAVYLLYPGDVTVYSTRIWVPVVNATLDLGAGYYLFLLLLLVGTTNAVNLTDGLDGLASSVTIPVMLAFAYIGFASGLLPEALFALVIVGCCLGFLIYNHHPAKCFMGDTGSLALGGRGGCRGHRDPYGTAAGGDRGHLRAGGPVRHAPGGVFQADPREADLPDGAFAPPF